MQLLLHPSRWLYQAAEAVATAPPPTFEAQILSNPVNDGDIKLDTFNLFTVTQGNTPSVFAGIDPITGSEYRTFLYFSLSKLPSNAFIDSAKLDLFIDSFNSVGRTIPIRIELVSFTPPSLVASDYDRTAQPPLATVTSNIFLSDVGHHVLIDVTPLVDKAQLLGLANFQIRILEDFVIVDPGLFEINDATTSKAPLLDIIYQ